MNTTTVVRFIVSVAMFVIFQTIFGFVLGFLFGFVALFFVDTVIALANYRNQEKQAEVSQQIREENMLITIEAVEHKGTLIYLAYNVPNNKFLLQGLKIKEFAEDLKKKFEGKTIYVSLGEDKVQLLDVAIQQYTK